jgi:hypothetical protein
MSVIKLSPMSEKSPRILIEIPNTLSKTLTFGLVLNVFPKTRSSRKKKQRNRKFQCNVIVTVLMKLNFMKVIIPILFSFLPVEYVIWKLTSKVVQQLRDGGVTFRSIK